MTLNIPNLDKLIAHMRTLRPDQFDITYVFREADGHRTYRVIDLNVCGTAACIAGECGIVSGKEIGTGWDAFDAALWLGVPGKLQKLFCPPNYMEFPERYPLYRAIATLKRLRDRFLATGEIVVDWGPEIKDGQPWSAPQAVELSPPALPEEITRLLAPVAVTEGADHE